MYYYYYIFILPVIYVLCILYIHCVDYSLYNIHNYNHNNMYVQMLNNWIMAGNVLLLRAYMYNI